MLFIINGLSPFNNFSFTAVQGFETMNPCETAKITISNHLDLSYSKADKYVCVEVKK